MLPVVLPTALLVLPLFLALPAYAGIANLAGELHLLYRMWRAQRYVSGAAVCKLISKYGGTLVIKNPSAGWNYTHAWWTPDDLLSLASSPPSTDKDYESAIETKPALLCGTAGVGKTTPLPRQVRRGCCEFGAARQSSQNSEADFPLFPSCTAGPLLCISQFHSKVWHNNSGNRSREPGRTLSFQYPSWRIQCGH